MVTSAVANLVATGKSAQIYSVMETGSSLGMQTLDQDLARLLAAGRIGHDAALAMARNPALLRERMARWGEAPRTGSIGRSRRP